MQEDFLSALSSAFQALPHELAFAGDYYRSRLTGISPTKQIPFLSISTDSVDEPWMAEVTQDDITDSLNYPGDASFALNWNHLSQKALRAVGTFCRLYTSGRQASSLASQGQAL